jgi:hypothetical protein
MAKLNLNVGHCKDTLSAAIDKLSEALHEAPLTGAQKTRYAKAILNMSLARVFLKKVDCEQPDMSYEMPPSPLERRGKRAKRSKRR